MTDKPFVKGDRVAKTRSAPGDRHQDGALGTVVVVYVNAKEHYSYLIDWDHGQPTRIDAIRLEPAPINQEPVLAQRGKR